MVIGLGLHHQAHYLFPPPDQTQPGEQTRLQEVSSSLRLHHVKTIEDFRKIHAQFIKLGLITIPRHSGELLSACALSEWGSLQYARAIFVELDDPSTFDFNTMIRASVDHGEPESALLLFKGMKEACVEPDKFTFPFVLKACALVSDIRGGIQVHGETIKLGFDDDVFIQNSLINLYGKCRKINHSLKVFELMGSTRSVVSWSSLLAAHSSLGLWSDCLHFFAARSRESLNPDESSMAIALSSCSNLALLNHGRCIHCSLLRRFKGLNLIIQTSLIDMYMKCGEPEKGISIFERMMEKNIWTYSAVISGLAVQGDGKEALQVFSNMLKEGFLPDEAIYAGVLSACSHAGLVDEGLSIFDQMRFDHQIKPNVQHYGCMVDLLSRAGSLKEAYDLISEMPMKPSAAVWRCLLSACKTHKNIDLAEKSYGNLRQMDAHNAGDCIILSNMYAALNKKEEASQVRREIFDKNMMQIPGFSKVEVRGKMHTFLSHDKHHTQRNEVDDMLHQMDWQLRFEGYRADTSEVVNDICEADKKKVIAGHSQKIAIAFALLNTNPGSAIRVYTNLRMSNECHTYTALISKIFERPITVRDRNRFHSFDQGACSCGNYW
ncbi:Pentatricopeptide repeat-containing protein [Apostasia shenzhenica]|uniref:Pentatricopeptide repeat-containing protein n=1 Tax=Apostasia shenzhenica TaxID=1088818 RepID=A0A2I0ACF9_9ASPA|nr:Pentatricopeptide repeat-containing protein [Apostasia shenzhenica]